MATKKTSRKRTAKKKTLSTPGTDPALVDARQQLSLELAPKTIPPQLAQLSTSVGISVDATLDKLQQSMNAEVQAAAAARQQVLVDELLYEIQRLEKIKEQLSAWDERLASWNNTIGAILTYMSNPRKGIGDAVVAGKDAALSTDKAWIYAGADETGKAKYISLKQALIEIEKIKYKIAQFQKKAMDWFKEKVRVVKEKLQWVQDKIKSIPRVLLEQLKDAVIAATPMGAAMKKAQDNLEISAYNVEVARHATQITVLAGEDVNLIKKVLNESMAVGTKISKFAEASTMFWQALIKTFQQLTQEISNKYSAVASKVESTWEQVQAKLESLPDKIEETAKAKYESFKNVVDGQVGYVKTTVVSPLNKAKNAFDVTRLNRIMPE